ncbi:hypothetical protein ACXR6G_01950 [Ancylomarina sp. YFZ004]
MKKKISLIGCLVFCVFGLLAQNESKEHIDYRKDFPKSFFEEWHKKSKCTPLSNDTLIALKEIIDIIQPYPYKNRNHCTDVEVIWTKMDKNGIELTYQQIIEECNTLSKPVRKIADTLKFIFYDSRLKIYMVDSINQHSYTYYKEIIFKPELKGKILYIDNKNRASYDKIVKGIRDDNSNALGHAENSRLENGGKDWYGGYHWNAPFNRHMQELISRKCLNYSRTEGELGTIDPIRNITLTKDLNEAVVYQKPYEYNPQFVLLKKVNGEWQIKK